VGKIASKIEIFNGALRLACAQLEAQQPSLRPVGLVLSRLASVINALINAGHVDTQKIATDAIQQISDPLDPSKIRSNH
jgi:hypothetical protein